MPLSHGLLLGCAECGLGEGARGVYGAVDRVGSAELAKVNSASALTTTARSRRSCARATGSSRSAAGASAASIRPNRCPGHPAANSGLVIEPAIIADRALVG